MPGSALLPAERIREAYALARDALLGQLGAGGHWTGELSTSALATATAVMALCQVQRRSGTYAAPHEEGPFTSLMDRGLEWLAAHQNPDGGWGDTVKSKSNISTTMLCHAVFHATGSTEQYSTIVAKAADSIRLTGGVPALKARYGKDRTFSVPILTHCALAGLVDWREVSALPFELACVPHRFYKWLRLPVVSYALPALIAIGQVRHHHRRPFFPLAWLRDRAIEPSLRKLEAIQPSSGGFLEATPLTAFVTMSLAGIGRADHPVAKKGVEFLVRSVRFDGSWPIDTNLATWVTTLAINALDADLPAELAPRLREWLLGQQYRTVHPYTQAAPGGWAWTDLPGGVPDADDTPGAILALGVLQRCFGVTHLPASVDDAVQWLLDLQNSDGGWPTFCRGWGTLPFDRSSPDLTAHAMRALTRWRADLPKDWYERASPALRDIMNRLAGALLTGLHYLRTTQRPEGSWLPLWFGNQAAPNDANPTYGTSRVLAAFAALGYGDTDEGRLGLEWLITHQNEDGGWGAGPGTPSSVEETALALDVLLDPRAWPGGSPEVVSASVAVRHGVNWLLAAVESGEFREPSPIGFYFAKLWYFEKLYPLIFTVAALRRAVSVVSRL